MKKTLALGILIALISVGYANAYEPEFLQAAQQARSSLSASAYSASAQRTRPEANQSYPAPVKNVAVANTGTTSITKTLSLGLKNDSQVMTLQVFLSQKGYLTVAPDGNFGPKTLAAVKAFQTANGISPLGIVGPQTRALIK